MRHRTAVSQDRAGCKHNSSSAVADNDNCCIWLQTRHDVGVDLGDERFPNRTNSATLAADARTRSTARSVVCWANKVRCDGRAVIRPTFYNCCVAGQFRDSGLASRMTAVGHGATAPARASGSARVSETSTGPGDRRGSRGEEASMRAGPHPDCHSTVALQLLCGWTLWCQWFGQLDDSGWSRRDSARTGVRIGSGERDEHGTGDRPGSRGEEASMRARPAPRLSFDRRPTVWVRAFVRAVCAPR